MRLSSGGADPRGPQSADVRRRGVGVAPANARGRVAQGPERVALAVAGGKAVLTRDYSRFFEDEEGLRSGSTRRNLGEEIEQAGGQAPYAELVQHGGCLHEYGMPEIASRRTCVLALGGSHPPAMCIRRENWSFCDRHRTTMRWPV